MIDKGQWWEFVQDTGVTPLLFTRSAMGFLITTESQDLSLMSHPKDGQKIYVSIIKPNFFFVCVCVRLHFHRRLQPFGSQDKLVCFYYPITFSIFQKQYFCYISISINLTPLILLKNKSRIMFK